MQIEFGNNFKEHTKENATASKSERLKVLRQNKKMTQEDFAKLLGIKQSNISKYESGDIPITSNLENRLYLNIPELSPLWWENGDGKMYNSGVVAEAMGMYQSQSQGGSKDVEELCKEIERLNAIIKMQETTLRVYESAIKAQEVTIETLKEKIDAKSL